MFSLVVKWSALLLVPFSPQCLLPHSFSCASTTACGVISWTRLGRSVLKSKETNKNMDNSLFFFFFLEVFFFALDRINGLRYSVPLTTALPPSRRQRTAVEGQQLGQGSTEKLPKAVLSAKIPFSCPTCLSLVSELQKDLIPIPFIPSLCHCAFVHVYTCI